MCVDYLRKYYKEKVVLVVAHGLINRSIRAVLAGVPADRLIELPHMTNGEVVRLKID